MSTDNGLTIDLDQVREICERADVLTFGFSFTPERLLIDTRADREEGPLVALVAPVAGIRERYAWLGQNRGRFGAPEAFSFISWPHSARTFESLDVLGPVRRRLAALNPTNVNALDEAISVVRQRERAMTAAAILGSHPWQTLWSRAEAEAA
jgi:hypothetical protein